MPAFDLRTPHRRSWTAIVVLALLPLSACGQAPQGESECVSSADCAVGYSCIDGTCGRPNSSTDGLSGRDAGTPFAFDAGSVGYDASTPSWDAGRADSSGGSPDAGLPPADAGGACGQAACLAQGAECGQVIDACGTVVDCPNTCQNGYQCGSGNFANRCQCEPLSCSELNAECGTITDNCGVSRDCNAETGGCRGQDRCERNQCECQPRSCSGVECGDIDTGCGYMRNCGGCTAPERCGGGGRANQCGCTPTPRSTSFRVFRTARNVNMATGSTNWDDLGNGVQANGAGADFSVTGVCGYESGTHGCGCCTRAQPGETTTNGLRMSNSGLGIPGNATIRGIQVRLVMLKRGGTARIESLKLTGAQTSDDRARSVSFDDNYRPETFGGPTDLWGRTWTPAQLNSSDFSVRLQMYAHASCNHNSSSCQRTSFGVDYADVRVFYETCE